MDPALNSPSAESLSLFEDILNSGASLRVRVTGRSMSPFLRGGEVLTIRKVPGNSLKRGDLIFFRNHEGCPVVHRIVKKDNGDKRAITFLTKGDALVSPDEPVQAHDIFGKVFAIEKGSGTISSQAGMRSTLNCLISFVSLFEWRMRQALRTLTQRPFKKA